jgi:carboxyl-terminal processing protease
MRSRPYCVIAFSRFVLAALLLGFTAASPAAADSRQASAATDQLWRQGLDLVHSGDFDSAEKVLGELPARSQLTTQVRKWIDEYQAKQRDRKELDRKEFDRYVGYAKQRIERKEWDKALAQVLLAADVADDRDKFVSVSWVRKLVSDSLAHSEALQKEHKWREAWNLYWRMGVLYEREPRYQQLEREAVTHLRLDIMFKEDSKWEEHLERIRWEEAEEALQYVGSYFVDEVDFKEVAESGLKQLVFLAESKPAQDALHGLQDEDDRADFLARLNEHLDQIRGSGSVSRAECVRRFRRVIRDVNAQTVRLPEELLVSELMRGAMDPLDDFSTMIWPKEIEDFDKHTRGDFIGVGIQIRKNAANEVEVVTPLDDAPAYTAGIQAGDIITGVDGKPLGDVSINKVVEIITGPKDTSVTLTVRRGDKSLDFDLMRQQVKIQSVKGIQRDQQHDGKWMHWLDQENGIAYVRVTNFQRNTVEDVENVLNELRSEGMTGLVLDLRGNPGGLLDSAWRMSSLFLRKGDPVVSTRGRIRDDNREFFAPSDGAFSDLPIAVLADESSASASEIVSGAIRDNKRGPVIGARTFGKFSVQNLIPLGHARTKLKLTTASYYLPSGASLHRTPTAETWGVDPTIPVRLVRFERENLWQLRRDADLLGPPKPQAATAEDEDAEPKDGDDEGEETGDKKTGAKGDPLAKPDEAKAELPPLEQPDENLRPKNDPQLDTALLVLRVELLGATYPSVAAAENTDHEPATGNP